MAHAEILIQLAGDVEVPPARSIRRATARRASNRRATARSRHPDIQASISDFLLRHPASTVGDIAKGLSVHPRRVSAGLIALRNTGEVEKEAHGYRKATVATGAPASRSVFGGQP
jgi:hypothetical protein